jgi:hypothetical protein
MVYSLLCVILIGHAYDLLFHREHWPFSAYPMFAGITTQRFSILEFACLTLDHGQPREVPLNTTWMPILRKEDLEMLFRQNSQSAAETSRLKKLLKDYLLMYQKQQQFEPLGGPPLLGLRLYRAELPMQAAVNDPLVPMPPSSWPRKLILQVDSPTRG